QSPSSLIRASINSDGDPGFCGALFITTSLSLRCFTLSLGLPLVPALEEGASKRAVEQVEHQQCGRRFLVDLDPLSLEGEGPEDAADLRHRQLLALLQVAAGQ